LVRVSTGVGVRAAGADGPARLQPPAPLRAGGSTVAARRPAV
jgi:hypothetical protein